jgi:uncharacterized membrane protein YhhN
MSSTVPFVAFAVFAVANWVAVARGDKPLEYLTKPAALVALTVWAATGEGVSSWLIAALALSLLGDVYLMLPTDVFTAGLGAFLLAHVAYVIDFDVSLGRRLLCCVLALAVMSPFALRIVRAVSNSTLRIGVMGYMAVLGLMVGSALASGALTAQIGALLFMASDTILGWNRFVKPFSWARPAIMVTYHLGQLGLAYSLRGA